MILSGTFGSSYSSIDVIDRCINPTQVDFPSLQRCFRAASVQNDGSMKCLVSDMQIGRSRLDEPWIASGYNFWLDSEELHQYFDLSGGAFDCGTDDVMLLVSGYSPSGEPNGSNILISVQHESQYGVIGTMVMTRTTYNPPNTFVYAQTENTLSNYIKGSLFDVATADIRNVSIATIIRQSQNTGEFYLGDSQTTDMNEASNILGTVNLGSLSSTLQAHGYKTSDIRLTGIYFFRFIDGAPEQALLKTMVTWMGNRADGALYPGLMGL
jgi:hypothetical protein